MKKTVYLYKSGILSRKNDSLCLIEKNDNVHYLPIEQIDRIFIFGEVTFNKRVLSLLKQNEVSLLFFNYYGHYIGRFTPKQYVEGKAIIAQVAAYQDELKRLYIAIRITNAEIMNMIALVKYYEKEGYDLEPIVRQLEEYKDQLDDCISIDDLLLIEAQAKKSYYQCFDIILEKYHYHFNKRMIQPPGNEMNSLLSYGYYLLYADFITALDKSPLLASISFIHSISKTTESLQFDLADILKPVIIDRMVLRLIRKHQIQDDYFDKKENSCYLNKKGLNLYLQEYESQLEKSVEIHNKYYSYKNIITREVYTLYNFIIGKTKNYKPYEMKW